MCLVFLTSFFFFFCNFTLISEERLAQLNTELEISRANALEANSNNNESSNLSFEMSEAEM